MRVRTGIGIGFLAGWATMYIWLVVTSCTGDDCLLSTESARLSKLFPAVPRPYTCPHAGEKRVSIAMTQDWITKHENPIRWIMHLHPRIEDGIVSGSIYEQEDGNRMFEMGHRHRMYNALFPDSSEYPRPKDPIFLDVGANIGVHSLFFASLGVRTHAFEPLPANVALLLCSASQNPSMTETLTINDFGLAENSTEQACMKVFKTNLGDAHVDLKDTKATECNATGIKLRTLTDYWKYVLKGEHVYLMKIDTQGFEPDVIRGGDEMFRAKPPAFIVMEYSAHNYHRRGISGRHMLEALVSYGYEIQIFAGAVLTFENGHLEWLASTGIGEEHDLILRHHGVLQQARAGAIMF